MHTENDENIIKIKKPRDKIGNNKPRKEKKIYKHCVTLQKEWMTLKLACRQEQIVQGKKERVSVNVSFSNLMGIL